MKATIGSLSTCFICHEASVYAQSNHGVLVGVCEEHSHVAYLYCPHCSNKLESSVEFNNGMCDACTEAHAQGHVGMWNEEE